MPGEYRRDHDWQLAVAKRFLDPLYRRRGWSALRYPEDHPMQLSHVDVLLSKGEERRHVDEKMNRGREDGRPAWKISFEVISNSTTHPKKRGWGHPQEHSRCGVLLFGFADRPDLLVESVPLIKVLDCLWTPFPPLREWFWRNQKLRRWKEVYGGPPNHSLSYAVPIVEVLAAISGSRRFTLLADKKPVDKSEAEHPCFVCNGAYAPFGVGPQGDTAAQRLEGVRWYCPMDYAAQKTGLPIVANQS